MAISQALIRAILFTPSPEGFWGSPVLLEGEPGTGKTHAIAAVTRAVGLHYRRISPGECGEGQFGVVPVPATDGYLHYPPPHWVREFDSGGVLFVDELNTAPPALQAPLLGLVQLRAIGGTVLGPRTRVLGACNSTDDAAGGWDLAPALANRFCHLTFDGLPADQWVTGLLGGFASDADALTPVAATDEEARVMAAWPDAIAHARGMVAGFVTARPDLLHKRPDVQAANTRAWPSRRTWDYVVHALAGARVHALSAIDAHEWVCGFVGVGTAREFFSWLRLADMPPAADVLDGRTQFQIDSRRIDRTLAFFASGAALVVPSDAVNRQARAAVLWQYISCALDSGAPDAALPAMRALVRAKLFGDKAVFAKVFPFLKAAGIGE